MRFFFQFILLEEWILVFLSYLLSKTGMRFFINNVKEMGISHVDAVMNLYQLKLWRVQAEKMVAEDLKMLPLMLMIQHK